MPVLDLHLPERAIDRRPIGEGGGVVANQQACEEVVGAPCSWQVQIWQLQFRPGAGGPGRLP